jgi:hypothetical protein
VSTHEKTAYIGCIVRACLCRTFDGLPKTGGSITDDALHERTGDAFHQRTGDAFHQRACDAGDKRALTRSAGKFSLPAAFLFQCGSSFVSLN